MKIEKRKCQCDEKGTVPKENEYMYAVSEKIGMNHEPDKCEGWYNLKKYKRGSKVLYLCSCCNTHGDILLS